LVTLILTQRNSDKFNDHVYYYTNSPIFVVSGIALAYYFSRQFSAHSGGCLNPAIAIGLGLWNSANDGNFANMRYSYIFIIGPLIGASIAAILFRFLYKEYEERHALEGLKQRIDEAEHNKHHSEIY